MDKSSVGAEEASDRPIVFVVDSLTRAPSGELKVLERLVHDLASTYRGDLICWSFDLEKAEDPKIKLPGKLNWESLSESNKRASTHDENQPTFFAELSRNINRIFLLRKKIKSLIAKPVFIGVGAYRSILFSIASIGLGTQFIYYEHTEKSSIGKLWSILRLVGLWRASKVVVVNPLLLKSVPFCWRRKSVAILNPFFSPQQGHEFFEQSEGKSIILSVGRMFGLKRFDVLLKSFKIMLEESSDLELWIVGDGPLDHELRSLAAQLNIESKVVFFGAQSKLKAYYSAASLFLMTSESEALPVVLLESLVESVPIVSTPNSGALFIVENGINGELVKSWKPEEIASVVINLLGNPEKLALYRENSKKVFEKFSLDRFFQEWLMLLREFSHKKRLSE